MEAKLFSLVSETDPARVFAWGMEITDDEGTEAVVRHRDPATGEGVVAQHNSAASALRRWSRLEPLRLEWVGAEGCNSDAAGRV